MKTKIILFAAASVLWGFISLDVGIEKKSADLPQRDNSIPVSLNSLYPPEAPGPVFLFKMLGLASAFTATATNFFESDYVNMQESFNQLKAAYEELPEMVPEWKEYFPAQPVKELEAALNSRDMRKVGPAFENLGKVCHSCHVSNQAIVQHKFQWGNFSEISVTDPVTGKENSFSEHMFSMTMSYDGIITDLMEGQLEYSRKHFAEFKSRFEAMSDACVVCHSTERYYYVDDKVFAMIDNIGAEIEKESPDIKKIQDLSQGIGNESCYKCHLVHMPAAASQLKIMK